VGVGETEGETGKRKRGGSGRGDTYRLQRLLDLGIQRPALEGDDGGGRGVVGDGAAALLAEPAVDGVAAVGDALPLLDGAVGREFVLGDDDDEGCFSFFHTKLDFGWILSLSLSFVCVSFLHLQFATTQAPIPLPLTFLNPHLILQQFSIST
jgi:hypothetical protein